MTIFDALSMASVIVIALVCALTIIKYHHEVGSIVSLCLFVLMLCCVGLAFDESDGQRMFWSLPLFRVTAAIASVVAYLRLRWFWGRYGRYLSSLMR